MNQGHEQTILNKGSPNGPKTYQKKLTPVIVREIKIKTKLRHHLSYSRPVKIK